MSSTKDDGDVYDADALDYEYDEEELQEMRRRNSVAFFVKETSPSTQYERQYGKTNNNLVDSGNDSPKSLHSDADECKELVEPFAPGDAIAEDLKKRRHCVEEASALIGDGRSSNATKIDNDKDEKDGSVEPTKAKGLPVAVPVANAEHQALTADEYAEMPHLVAIRPVGNGKRFRSCYDDCYGKPPKLDRYAPSASSN